MKMIKPSLSIVVKGGTPVTLDAFKVFVKRDETTAEDDLNLTNILETATELIQHHADRAMKTQTLRYVLPEHRMRSDPRGIELPRPPLVQINSITCVDVDAGVETVVNPDIYYIDSYSEPGRLVLKNGQSWSDLADPYFVIEYDAGYGPEDAAVPDQLKLGVMLMAGHLYVEGMNLQTTELPPEVAALIQPYKIY